MKMRCGYQINESYEKLFPHNCPVIEIDGNGKSVGTCTFYLEDEQTCPRHGKVKADEIKCQNCEELFTPTGENQDTCPECLEMIRLADLYEDQQLTEIEIQKLKYWARE